MNKPQGLEEVLDAVSMILLASFGLGMLVLMLWFVFLLVGGDFLHQIHASLFDVTRHEFDLVNYCGIILVKLGSLMCFFFPWVGTRLALRRIRSRRAATMPR